MRLNKWLALLLAALLCGVLSGALAEADVALDGIAPEAASLEVAPLEEEALDALTVPEDLELDVDAGLGEIEPPAQALDGADAQEAPAGEAVANWEPFELLKGQTRDEHGNVIETYTYFYDEASNCYRILKGNNVRITNLGYDLAYNTENVTIPGKVRKYRVTEIADSLLEWGQNTIRSITIPNTVKTIGKRAFRELRGLKKVTIPNSVTSIGDSAFAKCDYLTSVTIPGSVKTLGNSAFSGCTVLARVKLNKGLKTIGDSAFSNTSLVTVVIPESVEAIGDDAFYECHCLTSITIPKGTQVGDNVLGLTGEGLTVRTYSNSSAEAYAKGHWLKVEYLDAPTSITLNYTGTVQLEKYQKLTLVPTLTPEGCAPYVTWQTSHICVGVSPEGVVSAYDIGKATITAYDANGKAAASVDIEVIPPKPTSVSINYYTSKVVKIGKTRSLYATFEPYDAEANLTWSSSDTGVATVDQNGEVTGVSAGTVDITVTTDNGLSATLTMTVVDS